LERSLRAQGARNRLRHDGERTGERVRARSNGADVKAVSLPTKLHDDCALRRVVGCNAWNNTLKSIRVSTTRDFEPDPNMGGLSSTFDDIGTGSSLVVRLSAVTSHHARTGARAGARDVVLAARIVVSGQTRGTPFSRWTAVVHHESQHGLGGSRTIRGFRFDRFVGPIDLLANVELR